MNKTFNSGMQLSIQELEIPFRVSFKHASAERSKTESVLVEAKIIDGEIGYGESCPRRYVTGETVASVRTFFNRWQKDIQATVCDIDSMRDWMRIHRDEIDKNPAAWCAIELALLDFFGKTLQLPVEQLLGLSRITGKFAYTAVLGDSSDNVFQRQFEQYRDMGFKDFKVKLSGTLEKDRKKMQVLTNGSGDGFRVRVDANNLWQDIDEAGSYLTQLNFPFFAIEEPLASKDIGALAVLAELIHTKIILDESLIRSEQLSLLAGTDPHKWIINVRVSKMGGILRSLDVVGLARQQNIPVVVGAQVGETSLLSRAALTIANTARDALIAQEGAYGSLLLEKDIWQPEIMFGKSGVVETEGSKIFQSPGFGLQVDVNALK